MVSMSIDTLADFSSKRNGAKKEEEKKRLSQDPVYIGRESEPWAVDKKMIMYLELAPR